VNRIKRLTQKENAMGFLTIVLLFMGGFISFVCSYAGKSTGFSTSVGATLSGFANILCLAMFTKAFDEHELGLTLIAIIISMPMAFGIAFVGALIGRSARPD
jgi:hypothetical protein